MIKLNCSPGTGEQATAKYYVDQSISEPTLVKKFKNNDFNNHSSSNISHLSLNSEPNVASHAAANYFYAEFLSEKDRMRRDLSLVFNDEGCEFDKITLTILSCITVNRIPITDSEL